MLYEQLDPDPLQCRRRESSSGAVENKPRAVFVGQAKEPINKRESGSWACNIEKSSVEKGNPMVESRAWPAH